MEGFSSAPGTLLAQRFRVIEAVGTGGMGIVYRVHDLELDTTVALKILFGKDPAALTRFSREATVLKELRHPSIVRYIAHGQLDDGSPYLAMEWLQGEDLSQRLKRQPLSHKETVELGLAVASALAAAHSHGIVHRDIKPANLFLDGGQAQRVKLLDFGIARLYGQTAATRTGTIVGTPDYMAPEQVRGERDIDHRADLFSLGCVLYECLAGRAPFVSEHLMGVFAKILFEPPPNLLELRPSTPEPLVDLVSALLSKNVAERPAHAALISATLQTVTLPQDDDAEGNFSTVNAPRPIALTANEQRLLSIVVMIPDRSSIAAAMTVDAAPRGTPMTLLSAVCELFDAHCELLPDGTVVAMLFGQATPLDQARQAARFALRARERWEQEHASADLLAPTHIVVCTGWGEVERGVLNTGVIDRAVQLVSHLENAAPQFAQNPTESSTEIAAVRLSIPILIDETTRGFLDEHFLTEARDSFVLLTAEQPIVEPQCRVLGRSTPFFGRERELSLLTTLLRGCVDDPRASAAVVIAEPGMGKSRLCQEFLQRAAAEHDLAVWIARGDPLRAGSPHRLLAQSLRRALSIAEGLAVDQQRDQLYTHLARLRLDDRERVGEFLAEMLGIARSDGASPALSAARNDPVLMGDQLRRAVLELLDAETDARPILWVLEDLHWGDLPTVRLIDAALRQLAEKPLCVVALARPSLRELFPHLWEGRDVQEILLSGLSRKASEKIARAVLGEVSTDILRTILDRATGNAFLLEELLRAAAAGQLAEVPSTVLAMVQSRIERLEPQARRVLRGACIFGPVFFRNGVAVLLGQSDRQDDVTQWLELLCERELIARRPDSRFAKDVEYTFVHALVRDAAYAMMTEVDRALGHRLAAQFLEQAGDTDALALAEHYERGGELPRAVLHYRRAAWGALEGNDFDAALRHADRAIACGASGLELGDLHAVQVEVHQWRGGLQEAMKCARAALSELPRKSARWFQVLGALSVANSRTFNAAALQEVADQLTQIGEEGEDSDAFIITAARTALQVFLLSDGSSAQTLSIMLQRFFDPGMPPRAPATMATLQMFRGFQCILGARMDLGLLALEESARLYEQVGDLRNACSQRLDAVFFYEELGEYPLMEKMGRSVVATVERLGLMRLLPMAHRALGQALIGLGKLDEAAIEVGRAHDLAVSIGDRRVSATSTLAMATIYFLRGQIDQAARFAEEGLKDKSLGGVMSRFFPRLMALVGQIRIAQGNYDEALVALERGCATVRKLDRVRPSEVSMVFSTLAELLLNKNDPQRAREVLQEGRARLLSDVSKVLDETIRTRMLLHPANAHLLSLAARFIDGN